jgi:hypothetical protein
MAYLSGNSKLGNLACYLIIMLVGIIGFFPVSFMQHPLIYDAIDVFYPNRFFTGECLREGILPLWNPHQHLGYPIFGDGSAGVWYPIAWFFGALSGYTITILHLEFILHIILAGIGMFCLAKRLKISQSTALILGICYMLSGFFVGNAQHLPYVVSGAWLPFFLGAYYDLVFKKRNLDALKTGFYAYLLLSGGYPAFVFILIYLVSAIFLYRFFLLLRLNKSIAFQFFRLNVLAGIASVLFSSVLLVSFYLIQDKITRTASFSLEEALFGPLSIPSLVSFISPFATVKSPEQLGTDISMANAYIGIIPLVFFFGSFLCRVRRFKIVLWILCLFFLAVSVGDALPVRGFLFEHVPLMNLFRFPSVFRIFLILCMLLLSGRALDEFVTGFMPGKRLVILLSFVLASIIALFISQLYHHPIRDIKAFLEALFSVNKESILQQHFVFQAGVQIFLASLLLFVVLAIKNKKVLIYVLIAFAIFDMAFSALLNAPYTVYYDYYTMQQTREIEDKFPSGFPIPSTLAVERNNDMRFKEGPFWRNTSMLYKAVSVEGFNTYRLQTFEYFNDSLGLIRSHSISNPVVYSAESLIADTATGLAEVGAIAFVDLAHAGRNISRADIMVENFNPVEWQLSVNAPDSAFVVLQQVYFPGWKVYVNGIEQNPVKVNAVLMGAFVPSGNNKVEFVFSSLPLQIAFWVSVGSFTFFLGFLAYSYFKFN